MKLTVYAESGTDLLSSRAFCCGIKTYANDYLKPKCDNNHRGTEGKQHRYTRELEIGLFPLFQNRLKLIR